MSEPGMPPDGGDPPAPMGWEDQVGSLPEDLRSSSVLTGVESFEGFVKWADNANKMIGQKAIVQEGIKPPDPEDLQDIRRFFSDLGVPEDPSGYDMADFEVPEGTPWDDTLQGKMLESAHRWGVNPEQAKGLFKDLIGVNKNQYDEAMGRLGKWESEKWDILKKAWGDDYEAKRDLSGRSLRYFAEQAGVNVDDVIGMKTDAGTTFGDDATVNALFAAVGEAMGEDQFHAGAGGAPAAGNTPEQAIAKIRELAGDTEFREKIANSRHPENQAVREQWDQLHKEAYPPELDSTRVDPNNLPG